MVLNRKDLKQYLKYEKNMYELSLKDYVTRSSKLYIWKYVKYLRYSEYYRNSNFIFSNFLFIFTRLKKNRLGIKLGIEISDNTCDIGLMIWHPGFIVINGGAKIGKNFQLHGCNCIGNLGDIKECPKIGDNVDFGVGASAFGDIKIGNNIKIGANSTCVKDCSEDFSSYVGSPAIKVKKDK